MDASEQQAVSHLEHPALLYATLEDFLETTVPFLEEGAAKGEVLFVAARGDYLPALGAALAERGRAAHLIDTDEWHPHPASRLRAFYEFVTNELATGSSGIRLVGEPVWPSGPPEFVSEWQRYESVLNAVLAPFPISLLCLYDASRLDPTILEAARRTHRTIHLGGVSASSHEFEDPEDFLRRMNMALPPAPPDASTMSGTDLLAARRFVSEQAIRAGVGPDRALDLSVAANEILTNANVHAGGATALRVWVENDRFICQIEDRGVGIDDPLAGYRPCSEGQSGRGLWLARQLVDLLQIIPATPGTTVRLHASLG